MKEPLVSVIIPVYNATKYIDDCLGSILNQTYSNIEVVLCNDSSTDESAVKIQEWTKKDNRIVVLENEVNKGYLRTCNTLMKKCTGDYIIFQDSDDYSKHDRIRVLYDYLQENPSISMVGSNVNKVTSTGQIIQTTNYSNEHEDIFKAMPDKFLFCGATFMFTREVYETIGGYHEYFDRNGYEDYYWTYLIMEKFKIHILSAALYYYRFNPVSVSNTHLYRGVQTTGKMAKYFVQQRKMTGVDSLVSNNLQDILRQEEEIIKPYKEDRLLHRKELLQRLFWNAQYRKAYGVALSILVRNPLQSKKFYKDLYIYLPAWLKGSKGRKY
jgi:glycosyltransferase involved in cell wall biosynthesis